MASDPQAQQLHDKATRGIALSVEEQVRLENWYALLDQEECAGLAQIVPQSLPALQAQVNAVLDQLPAVLERIKALAGTNQSLRREIADLQQHLAQTAAAKSS
jgi:hypothetical protein